MLTLAITGCHVERASQRRDSATSANVAQNRYGAASTSSDVVSPSGARETVEDSVLNSLLPGASAITPSGDWLTMLAGGMLDQNYLATEYRKNGQEFVRVQRSLGRTTGGAAVWSTRARFTLPPMARNQALLFAGLCGVNNSADRYVLAIPAAGSGDTAYRNIQHAWRFEPRSEMLRPISTASVVCHDVNED